MAAQQPVSVAQPKLVQQQKPVPVQTNANVVPGREPPVHVKVCGILYYIGAGLSALAGLLFIIGGVMMLAGGAASFLGNQDVLGGLLSILGPLLLVGGLVILGMAILGFFTAKGLYNGRNGWRVFAIVLSILGVLGAIGGLVAGNFVSILSLVINGYIFVVLTFVQEVKDYFMSESSN